MAAIDTKFLGEILSVQKAILKKMDTQEKNEETDKKAEAKAEVSTDKGMGGFTEMLAELKTLNDTSKKQLTTLEKIEKKLVGGSGTSGGGISIKENAGDKLGSIGAGMVSLGTGILVLVGAIAVLALITPIIPIAIIGAVGVGLITYGFMKLFDALGNEARAEQVKLGTENMLGMAKAIALFTLSVALSALAISMVGFENLAMLGLTILALSGLFFILGKGEKSIKEGAMAAAFMGLGMAAIGLGVLALVFSLKAAGDILGAGGGTSVLIGGLAALGIIAVAGITFAIIGMASEFIIPGALAVAAIGLGLAVFGLGLSVYLTQIAGVMGVGGGAVAGGTKISGGFFDTVGSMLVGLGVIAVGAVTLVLYGTIFALAGQIEFGIPEFIVFGAIAFAATGLGLAIFGLGLDYYLGVIAKHAGVSGEGKGMEVSADSFVSGLVVMGGAIGMLLGIGGIFALAGVVSPLIGLGAAAFAGIGLAMAALGFGIHKFIEYVPPGTDIGKELKNNLMTIKDAFLALVSDEPKGGLMGFADSLVGGGIVGAITGGGKLAVAIGVAIGIGPALSSIAAGIGAWADLQNVPKIIGYDKMGQPIFDKSKTADVETALDNLTTYLPGIVKPFIDLSNQANLGQQTSLLSELTGINLSSSPFARGVSIAGAIGPVLTSLAQGIGAFADITQAPRITGYDKMGQPIYDRSSPVNLLESADQIGIAITAVLKPFIDLSKTANLAQESSLLSEISGINLSSSPFARGVSIAGNIGAVLTSLAQGIGTFAKLESMPKISGYDKMGQPVFDTSAKPVNVIDSIENFAKVISPNGDGSITKPFIDLANNAALKEGTSYLKILIGTDFGDSPFQRGVGLTGKIGAVLSSLGQGIGAFASLTNVPKITGYDKLGQPEYKGSINVQEAIGNLANILSIDGKNSLVKTFIDLAENANLNTPFSVGGFLSEAIGGANTGDSPLEKGLRLGLQFGEIISNIGSGIGQMANLAAIPVITGYDKQGRPQYGKPVNALSSVANFGTIMGQLIIAFADASKKAGPYGNAESLEAIGPTIGGILSAVTGALDMFSNPKKLKMIKGYDEKGKPIYYTNKFVDIDDVINTMNTVIIKIITTFGSDEVQKAMDKIDIDENEMIGSYLEMFMKPISGFAKIAGELSGIGTNLDLLTDSIVYATVTFIKQFGSIDKTVLATLGTAGDQYEKFSDAFTNGLEDFIDIDKSDPTFYTSDENPNGSALIGVATNISSNINHLVKTFTVDNTPEQFMDSVSGATLVNAVLIQLKNLPKFIQNFLGVNPERFGTGAKAAFDGLFAITTMNPKDIQKRSHLKQFSDEILRLSTVADPFFKFTLAFGKMSTDMKIFAENFKLMQPDGINAFKQWTDSIVTLSTADPSKFAANVVTANKAIDAGYGAGANPDMVNGVNAGGANMPAPTNAVKKKAINDANTPGQPKPAPQQQPASAEAIGAAVAGALRKATLSIALDADTIALIKRGF